MPWYESGTGSPFLGSIVSSHLFIAIRENVHLSISSYRFADEKYFNIFFKASPINTSKVLVRLNFSASSILCITSVNYWSAKHVSAFSKISLTWYTCASAITKWTLSSVNRKWDNLQVNYVLIAYHTPIYTQYLDNSQQSSLRGFWVVVT